MSGANGGFARYLLTVELRTAFLVENPDSRIFQDRSVLDISGPVFARYHGQGRLAPTWRFGLRKPGVYPRRSHTSTDMAFVQRMMDEEGLFEFFRHTGAILNGSSPTTKATSNVRPSGLPASTVTLNCSGKAKISCLDSCDYVPIRSWPLFKARHVLSILLQSNESRPTP